MKLIHFWSEPASERLRLALQFKGIDYELIVPDYDDDEIFFTLGVARSAPIVQWSDDVIETNSLAALAALETRYPQPSLWASLADAQWQALLNWRSRADTMLDRLYAPIRPAYRDIGDNDSHLASYKASVAARFHMSLEALANDRYDAFDQLDHVTHFKELGRFVRQHRFYAGSLSVADILITADLFPLQILDGVTLPIDLMYYFERVQKSCGVDLRAGLIGE